MTNTEIRNRMRSSMRRLPDRHFYQSPQWKSLRSKTLKRDKYRCRCCEGGQNLSVHHITPRSEKGGDNLENLLTLCNTCHDKVEVGTITASQASNGLLCKTKDVKRDEITMYFLDPLSDGFIYIGSRYE